MSVAIDAQGLAKQQPSCQRVPIVKQREGKMPQSNGCEPSELGLRCSRPIMPMQMHNRASSTTARILLVKPSMRWSEKKSDGGTILKTLKWAVLRVSHAI